MVISSAPIIHKENKNFMYAPYQKEMKTWAKYSNEIQFCCPIWNQDRGLLIDEVSFPILNTVKLKEFDIKSRGKIPKAIWFSICNIWILLKAMQSADHIHLRCPGNMGLLASFVQILFPTKKKTAKYAGNWNPKSKQPWSYRLQKRILSNTFLTRNMQVLVYGEWSNQTKNIKPFFTATYSEIEIQSSKFKGKSSIAQEPIQFVFVGTFSEGKQPLYAIKIVEELKKQGKEVKLSLFGDGVLRNELEDYVNGNRLDDSITFRGNQSKEIIKLAYQKAHFLLLPSKSEGWPKVVAEAMFWGCVPVVTPVSCVPYMVGYGERGILLKGNIKEDTKVLIESIDTPKEFMEISKKAQEWSRYYTTDKFENEIKNLLLIS